MIDWEAASSAVSAISSKWTLLVLANLAEGPMNYNMLRRLTGLETKALSRCLRNMSDAGLIERELQSENPLRVNYHLTSSARILLRPIGELASWWQGEQEKKSHGYLTHYGKP